MREDSEPIRDVCRPTAAAAAARCCAMTETSAPREITVCSIDRESGFYEFKKI